MKKKVYGTPIRVGWILTLLGVMGGIGGFILEDQTKNMSFFALVAFGVFFVIFGLVTVAVYSAMERRVKRTFGDENPLLRFTMSAADYAMFTKAEADEIASANKGSLIIALFFCALVAVIGPFVVRHDGYLMVVIGIGLGIFLAVSAWIITKIRIRKLIHGDKAVVLTLDGAFIGSQFHTWAMPGSFLSDAAYFPAGEYEGCPTPVVKITYSALTGTIVTPYSFVIIVPPGMEANAQRAVKALRSRGGNK
jgi:hypothetical protein